MLPLETLVGLLATLVQRGDLAALSAHLSTTLPRVIAQHRSGDGTTAQSSQSQSQSQSQPQPQTSREAAITQAVLDTLLIAAASANQLDATRLLLGLGANGAVPYCDAQAILKSTSASPISSSLADGNLAASTLTAIHSAVPFPPILSAILNHVPSEGVKSSGSNTRHDSMSDSGSASRTKRAVVAALRQAEDASLRPSSPALCPLALAAGQGRVESVLLLLAAGASTSRGDTQRRFSPLLLAVQEGHVEVARLLLQHPHCNPNLRNSRDYTALHFAARFNSHAIARLLLVHPALSSQELLSRDGTSPLHVAAALGSIDVLELLIEHGVDVNQKDGTIEQTALHYAAASASPVAASACIPALLRREADVNATTCSGQTPLHIAARLGRVAAVQALLEYDCNSSLVDASGNTPLHLACMYGHHTAVNTLLNDTKTREQHANDPSLPCPLATFNAAGFLPLHVCCYSGYADCLQAVTKVYKLLDVRGRDELRSTPLHIAAEMGHAFCVQALLSRGALLDAKDRTGATPRDRAERQGHFECIVALVEMEPQARRQYAIRVQSRKSKRLLVNSAADSLARLALEPAAVVVTSLTTTADSVEEQKEHDAAGASEDEDDDKMEMTDNPVLESSVAGAEHVFGKVSFDETKLMDWCSQPKSKTFVGRYEQRRVAIRRFEADLAQFAQSEVDLFLRVSETTIHANILTYFGQEIDAKTGDVFIAMELFAIPLRLLFLSVPSYESYHAQDPLLQSEAVMTVSRQLLARPDATCFLLRFVRQIASAVSFLHGMNIIHGSLSPDSIVLTGSNSVKVSAFHATPTSRTTENAGLHSFIAPELQSPSDALPSPASDMYSMGALVFFLLSRGRCFHATSSWPTRIEKCLGTTNLHEVRHLIDAMTAQAQSNRPTILQALQHPFFWKEEQRMQFLEECSEPSPQMHEQLVRANEAICRQLSTSNPSSTPPASTTIDWMSRFPPAVLANLKRHRNYKSNGLVDVLRAVRNLYHHFQEQPEESRASILATAASVQIGLFSSEAAGDDEESLSAAIGLSLGTRRTTMLCFVSALFPEVIPAIVNASA
ncbi:hypothetical protein CAOG_01986 [Capsaspora owczarzaki ATCC 30864]|nr:hypothetical protein CAOG_01986 [Capsaspora owczarzaki ATCC 30864]|eukprot:XP_004364854.2 hypothetical protein CAOG_01986 [Capsaspora owczarzaki ATCC 30864]